MHILHQAQKKLTKNSFEIQKYGYNIRVPNIRELGQFYYYNINLCTSFPRITKLFNSKYFSQIDDCSVHSKKQQIKTTNLLSSLHHLCRLYQSSLSYTQKCIINNFSQNVMSVLLHIVHAHIWKRLTLQIITKQFKYLAVFIIHTTAFFRI